VTDQGCNTAEELRYTAFQDARFGLFLHWGLYCVLGGEWQGKQMDYIGEWIMSKYQIPVRVYEKLAAQFNPQAFDADAWVQLAKRAGMRYVVITSKHHEGFAMYHSHVDAYNIVDATPFDRDPLAELADACQRHGLRLGLYYSQDLDWHEPNAGDPGPDYPKNAGEMSWTNDWDYPDHEAKDYTQYFEDKVKPQVRELLTRYGPIATLWFDTPVSISKAQSEELVALVHELQPDCLINTRIGNGLGDYGSMGDNQVPYGQVEGIWEVPATLNDTWGYKHFDDNWKSAEETLRILAGLASKNVNYLLNIGPQPDGRFPEPAIEILGEIGDWMAVYGRAIHGTRQSPYPYEFAWGWITHRAATETAPETLYLLFKRWPEEPLTLCGLRTKVTRAYELSESDQTLSTTQSLTRDVAELTLQLPAQRPDTALPVIALELAGTADIDQRLIAQHQGRILLPAYRAQVHSRPVTSTGEPVTSTGSAHPTALPYLNRARILVNWLDTRPWVDWDFNVAMAGTYEISVTTSTLRHRAPWQGGHRLRIEAAGQTLEAILTQSEDNAGNEDRYHPQARSHCGFVHIEAPGIYNLRIQPLEIQPHGGTDLALVSAELRLVA
jgi:alpha-L-fucosidase